MSITMQESISVMSAEGYPQREIAEKLDVSRNTVAKYAARDDFSPPPPVAGERTSPTMAPHAAAVGSWLESDRDRPRKQRHTAKRVYDRLVGERGFEGSLATVERFVREWRRERAKGPGEGFLELEWPAGACQADYGHASAVIAGEEVALRELVVSWPHSNARLCVMCESERSECLVDGLMEIFAHVGGVPTLAVLDNATEAGRRVAGVVRESELFSAFRAHTGMRSVYCNPYSGHEKGSVEYLGNKDRFADAFNYLLYDGCGVIRAEELRPFGASGVVTAAKAGSRVKPTWKSRDTVRVWQAMEGDGAAYAILGLEEQAYVSREMPARCMLYDAMSYDRQVAEIARVNRANGSTESSSGDFLSKLRANDVLVPVVTLVIYLRAGEWDAPESLHGLFGNAGDDVLRFVPDYKVNLVAPSRVGDSEFDKFSTELGLVLKYIKHSRSKADLGRMVGEDGRYRELGAESAAFINVVTDSHLAIGQREGKVDMCRAIDEMRRESREEGEHNKLIENARNLIANTGWDAMEALRMIGVPEADRPAIARELGTL